MPASWDSSGNQNISNIASGYLYSDVYVSFLNYDEDINVTITPTTFGAMSKTNRQVTVATNNLLGYNFRVSMSGVSQDLVHQSISSAKIAPVGGSFLAPTTLTNNTWGVNLDNSDNFFAVPQSSAPQALKTTNAPNETGDTTNICYGFKTDLTIPAGTYKGTILYTIEVNE
jgi:hypothetical protein